MMGVPLHINDLPPEVLTRVFLNLNDNDDRLSAREVCPHWNSVMESTVGVSKWIGDTRENRTYEPLSILRTVGVSDCTFSNVDDETLAEDVYLLPHLMRKASFDGVISPATFKHLTHPLEHLTTLTFDISTLAAFDLHLGGQPVTSITSLTVTDGGGEAPYEWEEKNLLGNFASIFNTDFPKLRRFDVRIPYFPRLLDALDSHLMNFVWTREHPALEHLSVSLLVWWSLTDYPNEAFGAVLSRGETQSEELRLFEKCCPRQNTRLQFHDVVMINACASQLFETFLSSKPLENVAWTFGTNTFTRVLPGLTTLLQPSWATLTDVRIKLKYPEWEDEVVDCSPLFALHHLERLVLKNQSEPRRRGNKTPSIENVSSLPPSLKTLILTNILMDANSVDWVSRSLPKLETLLLTGIGGLESRGMTIPTLLWILRESPTVRVLRIEGVNESCRWASLEFHWSHFISTPPECQTCKGRHQIRPWDTQEKVVGKEDRKLLKSLFDHTKHEFRNSIPYIQKTNGGWEVVPWDSLAEVMACRI